MKLFYIIITSLAVVANATPGRSRGGGGGRGRGGRTGGPPTTPAPAPAPNRAPPLPPPPVHLHPGAGLVSERGPFGLRYDGSVAPNPGNNPPPPPRPYVLHKHTVHGPADLRVKLGSQVVTDRPLYPSEESQEMHDHPNKVSKKTTLQPGGDADHTSEGRRIKFNLRTGQFGSAALLATTSPGGATVHVKSRVPIPGGGFRRLSTPPGGVPLNDPERPFLLEFPVNSKAKGEIRSNTQHHVRLQGVHQHHGLHMVGGTSGIGGPNEMKTSVRKHLPGEIPPGEGPVEQGPPGPQT